MTIQVRVRNFQSIEDASIVIEGLTVLTGTNNSGKSAMFRAIRGAFSNARGTDFVRVGTTHCVVDLSFEDGQTLTWKKGSGGINDYVVNKTEFKRVGAGVPAEAQVFGVAPIRVADTELWPQIAPQITGAVFLLDQTGSVIAEAVADVDRVNQLSRALKNCESDRRTAKNDLKLRVEDGAELQKRRDSFTHLDAVVTDLDTIEKRHQQGDKIAKAYSNLEKLGARHRRAAEEVDMLYGLDEISSLVPSEEKMRAARETERELKELQGLRDRWLGARELVTALSGLEEAVSKLPSDDRMAFAGKLRQGIGVTVELVLRHDKAKADLQLAEAADAAIQGVRLDDEKFAKAAKFTKAMATTRGLSSRYTRCRDEVAEISKALRDGEAQAQETLQKLSAVLGSFAECPTCGGDLHHVHQGP